MPLTRYTANDARADTLASEHYKEKILESIYADIKAAAVAGEMFLSKFVSTDKTLANILAKELVSDGYECSVIDELALDRTHKLQISWK